MLNAEILRDAEQRRFAWRCRRGLLELDIVLQAFVAKQFDTLNMRELQAFDDLLAMPDNAFWELINSGKQLKKTDAQATKTANEMLQKLRSVRLNDDREAE
ncbi:MAG: succinate dehydrogenase assembly factor 2 [Methylotenera sp. 24-45-7]|jgi:antitoxin CptB|nr:MAG: succinate dehydrogenase assembly factor 2 [Mehylophilales bacterium 35-46-6]OYY84512.1 MAG: succinate dehydrogenase assembly factor 2 [Methylophilales bacterium 16-45-9]OYZ41661.1 MAG: succinate dehydrogenase assembly factor 2 [Methylotenera sp. 24-45-7]OZA09492.1 MAG: succinate dehydrogenase assembly factor 2 [Methylotenera sp. 17-45-7]OZA53212.1 MAG: succinate dehydrogenase assembly factor 2 [Methylophilales bacterium 39-45-7]HQS37823.1 succinate dehydrogenase assembly factor 2 [Meth